MKKKETEVEEILNKKIKRNEKEYLELKVKEVQFLSKEINLETYQGINIILQDTWSKMLIEKDNLINVIFTGKFKYKVYKKSMNL
jgi:hypothetical protein